MKERKRERKRKEEVIKIPENVNVEVGKEIKVSGKKGELIRMVYDKEIKIEKRDKEIIILSKDNKKLKKKKKSVKAHIKNMIKGVTEGHIYKLRICSSHFPMNVSVENDKFIVKNFLGEKIPRVLNLKKRRSSIKIDGTEILIEDINKENAAQTAAEIEQLCKIKNRDKRIFQDGIFIVNKDGKEIK